MMQVNQKQAVSEIKELEGIYLQCRAVFPALSNSTIGQREFYTAPYYMQRGFNVRITTSEPITQEFIDQNTKLVKWINENAIIRLFGIMNYYGLVTTIDQNITGGKEVDLMRRMRNAFTKTGLNYRPENPDNIRLKNEVIEHFGLDEEVFNEGEIPTPVDTVVGNIFKSCIKYIEEKPS
jgi:hypothetical protein